MLLFSRSYGFATLRSLGLWGSSVFTTLLFCGLAVLLLWALRLCRLQPCFAAFGLLDSVVFTALQLCCLAVLRFCNFTASRLRNFTAQLRGFTVLSFAVMSFTALLSGGFTVLLLCGFTAQLCGFVACNPVLRSRSRTIFEQARIALAPQRRSCGQKRLKYMFGCALRCFALHGKAKQPASLPPDKESVISSPPSVPCRLSLAYHFSSVTFH